jgi:multiple sugar transport system substrate-binding protein
VEDGTQPKLSRRALLKNAAAVAAMPLAAACLGDQQNGGATTPPPPRATASASAATKLSGDLRVLQGSHAILDFDTYVDTWAGQWGARNGVRVRIDRIPPADLPARLAFEAAAQSGHDVVALDTNNLPALFSSNLVDITDIADRAANRYGGWIETAEAIGKTKGRWYGFPDFLVPFLSLWRTDLWRASGFAKDHLETWDDLFAMAPRLKAAGNPIGTALSSTQEAEHTWRSLMWSYGAYEFSADGTKAAIDSNETRQVLASAKTLLGSMEAAVTSWTDLDNDAYLRSGKGAWICDPIDAYRTIEAQKAAVASKILVDKPLAGPAGRIGSMQFTVYGIWSFSKNVGAARQFLIDYSDDWPNQVTASRGYNFPFLKGHQTTPMPVLGTDPKLSHLQDVTSLLRPIGYPGPSSLAAYDALHTHVVTDMFASYATGKKSLDDSVAEAKRRLSESITRFPI